jgi:3',5'-cyclic AMP phosphodiesterase CpdA
MALFRWLHLTDLHHGMPDQRRRWPNVREIFYEDLAAMHDRSGPWDLVVFTGDLTQRGSAEEFDALSETLDDLWVYLGRLGSVPRLLAVPGNHDLVRPKSAVSPVVIGLHQWHSERGARREASGSGDALGIL